MPSSFDSTVASPRNFGRSSPAIAATSCSGGRLFTIPARKLAVVVPPLPLAAGAAIPHRDLVDLDGLDGLDLHGDEMLELLGEQQRGRGARIVVGAHDQRLVTLRLRLEHLADTFRFGFVLEQRGVGDALRFAASLLGFGFRGDGDLGLLDLLNAPPPLPLDAAAPPWPARAESPPRHRTAPPGRAATPARTARTTRRSTARSAPWRGSHRRWHRLPALRRRCASRLRPSSGPAPRSLRSAPP